VKRFSFMYRIRRWVWTTSSCGNTLTLPVSLPSLVRATGSWLRRRPRLALTQDSQRVQSLITGVRLCLCETGPRHMTRVNMEQRWNDTDGKTEELQGKTSATSSVADLTRADLYANPSVSGDKCTSKHRPRWAKILCGLVLYNNRYKVSV
jgi:hypothetical protein